MYSYIAFDYPYSSFTKKEKDACFSIIEDLVECANIARKEGVLALEDYAWNHENYFLRMALSLVVDGTDPALVENILKTVIGSEEHKGSALLERVIISAGMLCVQQGMNPYTMKYKLYGYLGEDYLKANDIPKEPDKTPYLTLVAQSRKEPLPEAITFDKSIQLPMSSG